MGDPIAQATSACGLAGLNEVIASSEFYEFASAIGLENTVQFEIRHQDIALKASGDEFDRCVKQQAQSSVGNSRSRAITDHVEGLELDHMKEYWRLISLYSHPVEKATEIQFSDMPTVKKQQNQTDAYKSEMRNVFVAFLNVPVTLHKASKSGLVESKSVHQINRVFNLVSSELLRCKGYSEAFIDDKGFSMMITFGLRGSWFPSLISAVALPAILSVAELLSSEDVSCRIGATFGNVHCGFLGSKQRHEYTVLGPSVNLAARLMTSELNNGLLVDQSVRDSCNEAFTFRPIGYTTAKGFSDKIMTYKPIMIERLRRRCVPAKHFVGRKKELDFIASKAKLPGSRIVLIEGSSGLGKSALLFEASPVITKMSDYRKTVLLEHIDGDARMSSVPFGALLPFVRSIAKLSSGRCDIEQDFTDEVRRLLSIPLNSSDEQKDCRKFKTKELISLAFQLCKILSKSLSWVGRLIISIQDCHRLDSFSWRTLAMLLEANDEIFLLGTTTTTARRGFRMDEETGDLLFGTFLQSDRLSILKLDFLPIEDIRQMALETLGADSVQYELINSIYAETGGRPLFVQKVLERLSSARGKDFGEDLIIDQLDRLSSEKRRYVAVASCLGSGFTSDAVGHILEQQTRDTEVQNYSEVLDELVQCKLLRISGKSASGEVTYAFLNDRWRQKMLDMTLKSQQREIQRLATPCE